MAKEQLLSAIAELKLTMTTEFVPWSKSRNAKAQPRLSDRSLNWRVTLLRDGREVLTTDYSAGIAHCPSYGQGRRETLDYAEKIARETEHGRAGKKIEPDICDVVSSLALDASVLDHSSFESWARDYGYDEDSRKAEATYKSCLAIALQLRASLGDDGLCKLCEAAQDY